MQYFEHTSNPLYSEFIALSRYARYRDDLGRRELWPETVDRLCNFWKGKFPEFEEVIDGEIKESILYLDVMGSMRSLMTAGEALDRCNVAGYNCSYVAIESPRDFDEILYILMNGTGVGFSVERQYVQKLPEIAEEFHHTDTVIHVSDSKLGWAKALKELLSLLWNGEVPKWDLSKVRPAGARLKTFGGRASGPEPLESLFQFSVDMFKRAAGRKLTSLECHDLVCKIADIVVVGGVRRSALISLSNLSDDRMRKAKSGQWWVDNPQRALANNSYVADEKPDFDVFLKEWVSLHESKSGERGIFSRKASKRQAQKTGRREENQDFGTNPCFTGDTLLLTECGYFPIGELENKEINIWNGEEWSKVTPFSTGVNDLVKVDFTDGTSLRCTPYHNFLTVQGFNNSKQYKVEAKDLTPGTKIQKWDMPVVEAGEQYGIDPYSQGFYSGDGNKGYTYSWVYGPKEPCFGRLIGKRGNYYSDRDAWSWKHGPMLDKNFVPVNGSIDYCLNWFAGLMDADGTVTRDKNGNGLQIVSIDHDFLYNLKIMLSRLGIRAKVVSAMEARENTITNQRGETGTYWCQESKRLLVGNQDTYHLMGMGIRFERLNVHQDPPQRDARQYVKVKSVEWLDNEEETFCVTEPKLNQMTVEGMVTGNCSEIVLRNKQFCNLSEVVVRPEDTLDTLKKKVRVATILGTFQSTLTDFRYLRKKWKENTEEERLLGVSMTGIMDHPMMSGSVEKGQLEEWLDELRQVAIETNKEWADKLGIEQSVAISCVKPSGTVSQLVDSASGIHPRFSPYYLRTVRADKKDPLATFMIDKGFYAEEDKMNKSNWVFYFPMKSPDQAITADDMGAQTQLSLWKVYQDHWCEHKPSMTCYYKDDEFLGVGQWIWENFEDVSGISFLPVSDHVYPQAPYIPVDKEEYEKWLDFIPSEIDWSELVQYESGDETVGSQEMACSSGSCEII